jgi:hypothetical protein
MAHILTTKNSEPQLRPKGVFRIYYFIRADVFFCNFIHQGVALG